MNRFFFFFFNIGDEDLRIKERIGIGPSKNWN